MASKPKKKKLVIELDNEVYDKLIKLAAQESREITGQAAYLIRKSLST